ncbi:hypothetical protein TNCV_3372341 [Trichonephila clavipes]|nr:hypothetical protein TNCV_3372341 [Trichonephila clavipes]
MHHHTGPAPGIMVWGGIVFHFHIHQVRIAGTLKSQHYISDVLEPVVLPYIQRLPSAILKQARPHVARNFQKFSFINQIELLSWLSCSPYVYPESKTSGRCLQNDWPGIHNLLLQHIKFGDMWKPHRLLYPKVISKAFLIQCLGVWQRL